MEKITYIYKCTKCKKFKEEPVRNDNLPCCNGIPMRLATPDETIKHYKRRRNLYNLLTILFTIILPVAAVVSLMFVGTTKTTETTETLGYKLPVLTFIVVGAIVLKGKKIIEDAAAKSSSAVISNALIFLSKNMMYLLLLAMIAPIIHYLSEFPGTLEELTKRVKEIRQSLLDIAYAISIVITLNTLGYCIFDRLRAKANYFIERAVRQAETIQAMEISGR